MAGSQGMIITILIVLAVIVGLVILYLAFMQRTAGKGNLRSLMGSARDFNSTTAQAAEADKMSQQIKDLKNRKKKNRSKKEPLTLKQKFFMAGIFNPSEQKEFYRLRIIAPCVSIPLLGIAMWQGVGLDWAPIGLILGGLIGVQIPQSVLERKIKQRSDDIMYFLPLVIEQIAIGVSSGLDIGPCIQRVVSMADERDSHNAVTELVRISSNFVRSGVSLDEALSEVGKLSGHTELKHTFMQLAQVARHGGELTKQLQELADAVSSQRETRIEAMIKKLELVATGPVALVFTGFLSLILIGFGLQLMKAFGP